MDLSDESPLIDRLHRHGQAAKAIARAVLGDEHLAEDVLQDAYAKALVQPPRHESNLSGWFLAIVRNLAIGRRRSDTRRNQREREAVAGEDGRAARSFKALTDAVIALDEPYRRAVLARFYEGLPPREIAKRDDVPIATVKSRIQRGVSRVRAQLEAEAGDDHRDLMRGLCVLAGPGTKGVALAAGGVALTLKTKVGAVAAVVLLFAGAFKFREAQVGPTEPIAKSALVDAPKRISAAAGLPEVDPSEGSAAALDPVTREEHQDAASRENFGHVFDAEGRPLEGVMVLEVDKNRWGSATDRGSFLRYRESDESLLRSGPPGGRLVLTESDGSFEFEGPPLTELSSLIVWSAEHGCEFAPIRRWEDNRITMRPAASVSGVVYDEEDRTPLAKASLWVSVPGVPGPLEALNADEHGRFQTSAHVAGAYRISASLEGYRSVGKEWVVTDEGDAVSQIDLGLRRYRDSSIQLLTRSGDPATREEFAEVGVGGDPTDFRWVLCARDFSTRAALDLSAHEEWEMAYAGDSGVIEGFCGATGTMYVAAWRGEERIAVGELELSGADLSCVLTIDEPKTFSLTIRCGFSPPPEVEAWSRVVVGARSGSTGNRFRTSWEDESLSSVLSIELPYRPAGNWSLGVRRDGYRQRWFEVPGDGTQSTIDCELHAITGDATVRVVDPEGNGVRHASVVVRTTGDVIGPQYANWPDADGYFVISELSSRPVDILVNSHGYAATVLFGVTADEIDGLVVRLTPERVVQIPHATDPVGPWGVRCEDRGGRTVFDDAWFVIARHGPSPVFKEAPQQAATIVVYDRITGAVMNRFPIDP